MPNQKASPTPQKEQPDKKLELFGLDVKIVTVAAFFGMISLVFGIFQSLTYSQREQIRELRREMATLEYELEQLKGDLAKTRASNQMIDEVALNLFQTRCNLQGGVFDVISLTCQVGQIRDPFIPPSTRTPGDGN